MSRSGRARDKAPSFKPHSDRKEVCSAEEEIRLQLEEDELLKKEEEVLESPWRAQEDREYDERDVVWDYDQDDEYDPHDFQEDEPEKSEESIDDGDGWFEQDYEYIDLDWDY